jgi:hypothetical protein
MERLALLRLGQRFSGPGTQGFSGTLSKPKARDGRAVGPPEQAMQRAVFQHLSWRGVRGMFAFHCPNSGKRSGTEAAIKTGLGVIASVPDVIAIKDGKIYGLELKSPGGKLLPAQHERPPELPDIQR